MKKKDLKILAKKIAEIENDITISSHKKEEIFGEMMNGISPKELLILSNYVENILNKKGDY